jgi:hypothetical protein
MGTLGLAWRISSFESVVDHAAYSHFADEARLVAVARSYLALLASLTKVDEEHPDAGLPGLVSDAIDVCEQAEADLRQQQEADDPRREEGSDAAERRRERAMQVVCPTCGAPLGTGCRTKSGARIGVHGMRVRAAAG